MADDIIQAAQAQLDEVEQAALTEHLRFKYEPIDIFEIVEEEAGRSIISQPRQQSVDIF